MVINTSMAPAQNGESMTHDESSNQINEQLKNELLEECKNLVMDILSRESGR